MNNVIQRMSLRKPTPELPAFFLNLMERYDQCVGGLRPDAFRYMGEDWFHAIVTGFRHDNNDDNERWAHTLIELADILPTKENHLLGAWLQRYATRCYDQIPSLFTAHLLKGFFDAAHRRSGASTFSQIQSLRLLATKIANGRG